MADLACATTRQRRQPHAYQPTHPVRAPVPPLFSARPMAQWHHVVPGGGGQRPPLPSPLPLPPELPVPRPSLPVLPVLPLLPVLPSPPRLPGKPEFGESPPC